MSEASFLAPIMRFSGAHLGGIAGATSYLADTGALATALVLTAAQTYPMPVRTLRNLRVKCPANPLAAGLVVEVYKNGSASGLKVTVTTGSTAVFTDSTHTIAFAAADTMDLRMDSTAAGAVVATVVATVEAY